MPVKAANDANVAAYGEMLQGGGKGHKNVVMVTLGTGVGGGIIGSGRILTGATGTAGEIGHIHVKDDEQEVCGCGCRGCLNGMHLQQELSDCQGDVWRHPISQVF